MTSQILALSCAFVLAALTLQGCDVSVPKHSIGNWEAKTNYLKRFEYVVPGQPATSAFLNSCSDPKISATQNLQCTGHGRCKDWNDLVPGADAGAPRLSFCECDRDYADPECTTHRKSQVTAFVLSLFLGMFGVDQLYLGYGWYALAKLATLGGGGVWYLFDICRIGSSAVPTNGGFQVAADLPHFVFVLTVITLSMLCAFGISIWSIRKHRWDRAHEVFLLREDAQAEEPKKPKPAPPMLPKEVMNKHNQNFSGYGATIPRPGSQVLFQRPVAIPSMRPSIATLRPAAVPSMRPAVIPSMRPLSPPMTQARIEYDVDDDGRPDYSTVEFVEGFDQNRAVQVSGADFAALATSAGVTIHEAGSVTPSAQRVIL